MIKKIKTIKTIKIDPNRDKKINMSPVEDARAHEGEGV